MLCLTISPRSFVICTASNGEQVKIVNNSNLRMPVGFDAPKEVKILRGEFLPRNQPPKRAERHVVESSGVGTAGGS